MSRVPTQLRSGLVAMAALLGLGGGSYVAWQDLQRETHLTEYMQTAAADESTSDAVKLALVMGAYYESSHKHIGKPYKDRLGAGQPWTVCNGITPAVARIDPSHYYTPAECYALESRVAKQNERMLIARLPKWNEYTVLQQATFTDFVLNKGIGAFDASTMKRKLLAGDVIGACRENERWTMGTVNGVKQKLPGLVTRANANSDLCAEGL